MALWKVFSIVESTKGKLWLSFNVDVDNESFDDKMVLDKFSNSIFEIWDFEPVPIFWLVLLEESLKRPMNF